MRIDVPPFEQLFGAFRVLSPDAVAQIHQGALQTLESVGVRFDEPLARRCLQKAGATVEGDLVRFPGELIEEALKRRAETVVLGAKVERADLELGRHRFLTTNGFGTTRILDPISGESRDATAEDLARLTRLADALEEVSYCQHQTTPADLPESLLDVALAFIVLANTSKHAHLSMYSARHADAVIEMGSIAGDHRGGTSPPVFSLGCCSISPLRFPAEATALMRNAVRKKIPFLIVSGAVVGVMAPVTMAGALVVQTAEHLAALTLAQFEAPGAPVVFGSFASPMDPRDGRQRLGAAELPLLNGATANLCELYGVPLGYGTGGGTGSSCIGVQAGVEKAITTIAAALAGVEVIHGACAGILDSGQTVCYEQMIIDAEVCKTTRRYLRGIDISSRTLALEVISDVGPGGNFLTSLHTARNFREAILISELWRGRGSGNTEGAVEAARGRVEELLSADVEQPLTKDQADQMISIWERVGLDARLARVLLPGGG